MTLLPQIWEELLYVDHSLLFSTSFIITASTCELGRSPATSPFFFQPCQPTQER